MILCRPLVAAALLILAWPAAAQAPQPPPDVAHETEQETIAKALADLQSEKVPDRQRAVLILSKYRSPAALAGIIRALSDTHPEIRQSAVVAVVENSAFAQAGERFLLMLGDDNVHIRRIVSTFIQQSLMMQGLTSGFGAGLSAQGQRVVRAAFRDTDVNVRKNMLKHFSLLRQYLSTDLILPLLKDEDRHIRMLALDQVAQLLIADPQRFAAAASHLTDDSDPTIRLQLAQVLSRFANSQTRKLLLKLADDNDFQVQLHARLALLRQGQDTYLDSLVEALDSHRMRQELAEEIISALPSLDDKGRQALQNLLNHEKPFYRMVALRTYGRRFRQNLGFTKLLDMMNDSFAPVRQEAGMLLRMLPPDNRPDNLHDHIMQLLGSRFSDVREVAVDLAAQQPNNHAKELLMEALFDEHADVRGKAIAYIVARRMEGWKKIVEVSLDDDSLDVRLATVQALLNSPSEETRQMLRTLYQQTQEPAIRQAIQQRLPATF